MANLKKNLNEHFKNLKQKSSLHEPIIMTFFSIMWQFSVETKGRIRIRVVTVIRILIRLINLDPWGSGYAKKRTLWLFGKNGRPHRDVFWLINIVGLNKINFQDQLATERLGRLMPRGDLSFSKSLFRIGLQVHAGQLVPSQCAEFRTSEQQVRGCQRKHTNIYTKGNSNKG